MLTFMFNQIPGSPAAVQREMYGVVERTFTKVLTRTLRRPNGADWQSLPLWIGCTDWPVMKWNKDHFINIALNEGAHVHMVALDPSDSRFARQGKTLEQHIVDDSQEFYFGSEPHLFRIQYETVTHDPGYVADYVLKALKTGRTSVDNVLVLPRATAELS